MRTCLPAYPVDHALPPPWAPAYRQRPRRSSQYWCQWQGWGHLLAVRNSLIVKTGLHKIYFQSMAMQAAHFFPFFTRAWHVWMFLPTSCAIECMSRHFSTKSYLITYLVPSEIGKLLHPQEFLLKENVDRWRRGVLHTDHKLVDCRYRYRHEYDLWSAQYKITQITTNHTPT